MQNKLSKNDKCTMIKMVHQTKLKQIHFLVNDLASVLNISDLYRRCGSRISIFNLRNLSVFKCDALHLLQAQVNDLEQSITH